MHTNSIAVVVPVFNEEDNIPVVYKEIADALAPLEIPWYVLFVDDGSNDTSLQVIKQLADKEPEHVRFIAFARNCGQSAAFAAGFKSADTDVVVTMDADLQNDPADIPSMLAVYEKGHDMVIGWRAERQDSWAKKKASRIANWIRNTVSRENVTDTGCSLKIMRAELARKIPMFTGMHRFLPTLMKLEGAHVAEVKVNHRPRLHGKSKYGVLDRALTTWSDLLAVRWMKNRYIRYEIKERR